MKYLKPYDKQSEIRKNSQLKKLKMSPKSIATGKYVIFIVNEYDFKKRRDINMLVLGKIQNYQHNAPGVEYVNIFIFDVEYQFDFPFLQKGKIQDFYSPLKNVLYTDSSLKKAQEEFERLKNTEPYCNWKYNSDVEKYNL